MSVDTAVVSCGNCGLQLDEDSNTSPENRLPCPSCGSMSRAIHVTVHDTITIKKKLGMKGRHAGGGKPFIEQVHGDDLHRDSGVWRHLSRVIDRENDEYQEVVKDSKTGEIVHECHEPLSQHQGHGAAKRRSEGPKDGEQLVPPDRLLSR
jgi:hypothetical protein